MPSEPSGLFLASSVKPSFMQAISPSVCQVKFEDAGLLAFDDVSKGAVHDASSRVLDFAATTYSRWFVALRDTVASERSRQAAYRAENHLGRHARVPYHKPQISEANLAISSMAESAVRSMFGDAPADYARGQFLRAVETGDLRAFKLRLLLIKARDALKGSPLHGPFSKGLEECISRAEAMAGCVPDGSPRRLSRAEKERKIRKEKILLERKRAQPELNLVWPDKSPSGGERGSDRETDPMDGKQDIEDDCKDLGCSAKPVTVTDGQPRYEKCNASCNPYINGGKVKESSIQGKIKCNYATVNDILDAIENGKIEPYSSIDEICEDLKSGKISPLEAFMFTAALEKYSPSAEDMADDIPSEEYDEYEDDVHSEAEGDCGDGNGSSGRATGFSYNPNGFLGDANYDSEDGWYD